MNKQYKYELHLHTSECDRGAMLGGAEIVRKYAEAGYSGMVVTDHYINVFEDRWFPETRTLNHEQYINRWLCGYRAAREEGERIGFTVLLGAEVRLDGQVNDYLLYGADEEFFFNAPRLHRLKTLEELVALLPEDVCIVQAHPFRKKMVVADPSPLFGLEGFNGGNPYIQNELAKIYAAHYGKVITSGSDFHGKNRFATGGIMTEEKILTSKDLSRVLRSGNFSIIETYPATK